MALFLDESLHRAPEDNRLEEVPNLQFQEGEKLELLLANQKSRTPTKV